MTLRRSTTSVLVVVSVVVGCMGTDIRPVPTSQPGAGGFDALIVGKLVADPSFDGGCVWLESQYGPLSIVWPYGYSARFGSTVEILDETGAVVARAGDEIRIGGGIGREFAPTRCRISIETVLVHSVLRDGGGPAP